MVSIGRSEDGVLPFSLSSSQIRGRLVKLGTSLNQALKNHSYPPLIQQLMGELMALGVMLASTIKYEGKLTLQTNSDGLVKVMLDDITSAGLIRGYASYDKRSEKDFIFDQDSQHISIVEIMGNGHIAFTVDQGAEMERFQGIVSLEGDTLSSCARHYFMQSEQIETDIFLTAGYYKGIIRSGGLMLQRMPDSQNKDGVMKPSQPIGGSVRQKEGLSNFEEDWNRATILMNSVKNRELLDPKIDAQSIVYRLFHLDGVRGYPEREIRFGCHCSRERVIATLSNFSQVEISNMFVDGKITVKCQFCNSEESFTQQSIDASILN